MRKSILIMACIALMASMTLTSCHKDDSDGGKGHISVGKDLISSDVPSEGWTGSVENGVIKYSPEDPEEGEINSYYAFEMKDGLCREAVYNVVMPDPATAKYFAKLLNSGTWIGDDFDDYTTRSTPVVKVYNMLVKGMQPLAATPATRASLTLPIPVSQSGSVLYITIPNVRDLDESELRTVMDIWSGYTSDIPDHVIFGTYENGVYSCSNMQGLGIEYLIRTSFNANGFCETYRTSITLPTRGWAQLYYEAYEEQMWEFEEQFGQRPELKIEGNTVILDALIIGDVSHEEIDSMIYALDWINNRPFLYNIFG